MKMPPTDRNRMKYARKTPRSLSFINGSHGQSSVGASDQSRQEHGTAARVCRVAAGIVRQMGMGRQGKSGGAPSCSRMAQVRAESASVASSRRRSDGAGEGCRAGHSSFRRGEIPGATNLRPQTAICCRIDPLNSRAVFPNVYRPYDPLTLSLSCCHARG